VHMHMTNTRITDPEILEKRYPCVLRRFGLREGSGGSGRYKGGEGVIRDIEFREPVQCSILSERRSRRPYGLEGGGEGASGLNLVVRRDEVTGKESTMNLGGKGTIKLGKGDRIVINTPGGGGWGAEEVDGAEQNGDGGIVNGIAGVLSHLRGSVNGFLAKQETN